MDIGTTNMASLRVLVVDDEQFVTKVLSGIFEGLGVRDVHVASTGEKAAELLQTNEYDLVLSDVLMPGMGGRGLVRFIRETLGKTTLPVYAVTADSTGVGELRELGFSAVFVKPFTRDNVSALLRKILRTKGAAQ